MKKFTKLLGIVLIMALVMSISVSAFAADPVKNDSITITSAKEGETYEAYKLFDLLVNDEISPTAYSYKVNSAWAAFFAAGDPEADPVVPAGAGYQYVTINDAGYVTAISDAAALAKAAATWTGKPSATKSVTVDEGETTAAFTGLEDGYWLITSTLGTIAMTETTPDASAVTIVEKNPEDTIEKEVKEDSTGSWGEANDVQVGDVVEFKSTVKIVKGTRNVVVHDKMTSGLTYTAGSVAITGLTKGTEYTVNESPTDGDTFDITFTQSWIDGLDFGTDGYKEYEITYTASVNTAAIVTDSNGVAIVDQNNKTHVSFGDDTDSQEDTTTTTTHKFSVFKHAKDSSDNLAGAVFSLKKAGTVVPLIKIDDNNYRVATSTTTVTPADEPDGDTTTTTTPESGAVDSFTTVASGDIVIWGVDSDSDYSLEEITPPSGYNKLTAEVQVTVNSNNGTRIDVENNSGTELPSTGGIGTTIFYVVGSILVVAAGVLLITKKRMSREG